MNNKTCVFCCISLFLVLLWQPAEVVADTITSSPLTPGTRFDPQAALSFPAGGSRPLWLYPQQSRYFGIGPAHGAASFTCINAGKPNGDVER